MNKLKAFKDAYRKAKTKTTKVRIFNKAYNNLVEKDFKAFLKWQLEREL